MRLLLRDCGGYRLGSLVFSEVQAVCLTTQWETFESMSVYEKADIPDEFSWLKQGVTPGNRLNRFVRSEDEDDESVLPLVRGERQAFVVASSVQLVSSLKGR